MTGRSGRLTGRSMTGRSQTQVLSQVHPHPCPIASYLSNNLYPSFQVCLSCIDSLILGDDLPESFLICVTQLLTSINRHYWHLCSSWKYGTLLISVCVKISISPSIFYFIFFYFNTFPSPLGPREEFQWSWSCTSSHQDVSECRQYRGQNVVIIFEVLCFAFSPNVLEILDNFLFCFCISFWIF